MKRILLKFVKLLCIISLCTATFFIGSEYGKKKERRFRMTMKWYPGGDFIEEFRKQMVEIEYEDDHMEAEFDLLATFYFDDPNAKRLIEKWLRNYERLLTAMCEPDEWKRHPVPDYKLQRVHSIRHRRFGATFADFNEPLFAAQYSVPDDKSGYFGIVVDRTDKWVFLYSSFGG